MKRLSLVNPMTLHYFTNRILHIQEQRELITYQECRAKDALAILAKVVPTVNLPFLHGNLDKYIRSCKDTVDTAQRLLDSDLRDHIQEYQGNKQFVGGDEHIGDFQVAMPPKKDTCTLFIEQANAFLPQAQNISPSASGGDSSPI